MEREREREGEREIIFQKRYWREKSFQKKAIFAHIDNEIKINAIITFPTSVKIHFVCFTVTGSFLITIHLFGQFVRFSQAAKFILPNK